MSCSIYCSYLTSNIFNSFYQNIKCQKLSLNLYETVGWKFAKESSNPKLDCSKKKILMRRERAKKSLAKHKDAFLKLKILNICQL
jgi:hypothetical protein